MEHTQKKLKFSTKEDQKNDEHRSSAQAESRGATRTEIEPRIHRRDRSGGQKRFKKPAAVVPSSRCVFFLLDQPREKAKKSPSRRMSDRR